MDVKVLNTQNGVHTAKLSEFYHGLRRVKKK